MSVTVFSFDLAIRDSESVLGAKEIFILPRNSDTPRRLSNTEARHALAFLGMVPSHAMAGATDKAPLQRWVGRDAPGLKRSHRVHTVVRTLCDIGDFIAPRDLIPRMAPMPKGTVSSVLADLLRHDFVERRDKPLGYRLSNQGLEFFADVIAPKQAAML